MGFSQWAAVCLLAMLAGCLATPSERPPTSSITSSVPPTSDPQPIEILPNATVLPPVSVKDEGWSWSDCDFRSAAFLHKHEFAASMIPPGYRQIDNGLNIGNNVLLAFRCRGASIGNQTYFPNVTWAMYGIAVEASASAHDAARSDLLVLGVYADSEPLVTELRAALPRAEVSQIDLAPENWNITTSQPILQVHSVGQRPPPPDTTALWRLHFDDAGRLCWMDGAIAIRHHQSVELVAEAPSGPPNQISGGTGVLAGLGFTAHADGSMMGVSCLEEPA